MLGLVGNPEDQFSDVAAHLMNYWFWQFSRTFLSESFFWIHDRKYMHMFNFIMKENWMTLKSIWAPAGENQQCGFWPGLTQTRLYSYWRWLEAWNFGFRKKRNCTIQVAKTKALICVFVFRICKTFVFSWRGSYRLQKGRTVNVIWASTGENCYSGVPIRSNTNQAVQPKKMIRGLKFWI